MQRLTTKLTVWIGLFLSISSIGCSSTATDATPDKGRNAENNKNEAKAADAGPGSEQAAPKREATPRKPVSPKRILYIGRNRKPPRETTAFWIKWSLPYEICRQAILIGARDEMGCLTRDYWLHETPPESDDALCIEIKTHERPAPQKMAIELIPAEDDFNKEGEVKADWPLFAGEPDFLAVSLAKAAEEASRTTCPAALRKLGLEGESNKWTDDAPVPEDVSRLLEEATFTSQFLAVRNLHAAIREDGESLPRLYALVRGYAQLGMLTEHVPHPFGDVCKARAIVYAQRSLVKSKNAPEATAVRAAAHAFAGYHAIALSDFARIEEDHPDFRLPPWPGLAKAFCHYDMKTLEAAGKNEKADAWPDLLNLLALHYSGRKEKVDAIAPTLLEKWPECYRIPGELLQYGSQWTMLRARNAAQTLGENLYRRLADIDALPKDVKAIVARQLAGTSKGGGFLPNFGGGQPDGSEFVTRRRLIDALRDPKSAEPVTDDPHEMSWQSLGGFLWELSFAQVAGHAANTRRAIGETADAWVDHCEPLVRGHRFRDAMEAHRSEDAGFEAAKKLTPQTDMDRLGIYDMYVMRGCWRYHRQYPAFYKHFIQTVCFRDDLGNVRSLIGHIDYNARLPEAARPSQEGNAKRLMRVSPRSPLGPLLLVESDWESCKPKSAELIEKFPDHAALRYRIASRWISDPEYRERGIEILEDVCEKAPTFNRCQTLANVYRHEGKNDAFLNLYQKFYDLPEHRGIDQNFAASQIARFYIEHGRLTDAEPWAERAARCYSSWGLADLAHVNELSGRFEKAIELQKARAGHYKNHGLYWYLACRRTGIGDLDAARAQTLREYELYKKGAIRSCAGQEIEERYQVVALEEGKETPKSAFNFHYGKFKENYNSFYGTHALLLAMELGDEAKKKELLEALLDPKPNGDKTPIVQYPSFEWIKLVKKDLEDGKAGDIDDEAVYKLPEKSRGPYHTANMLYFHGQYLALAGKEDRAMRSWKKAVAVPEIMSTTRDQAILALWKREFSTDEYNALMSEAFDSDKSREE